MIDEIVLAYCFQCLRLKETASDRLMVLNDLAGITQ